MASGKRLARGHTPGSSIRTASSDSDLEASACRNRHCTLLHLDLEGRTSCFAQYLGRLVHTGSRLDMTSGGYRSSSPGEILAGFGVGNWFACSSSLLSPSLRIVSDEAVVT